MRVPARFEIGGNHNIVLRALQAHHSTFTGTGSDMNKNRLAFGVVTAVFFMWGFITVLNDVLVPHLKSVFSLD